MKQSKEIDFSGENIFVGIDVHKKSWKVNLRMNTMNLRTFSQNPSAEELASFLRYHYPGANYSAVYEAGFCGFSAQRTLQENGVNCIVVNPADVPTTDKDKRRKTDAVDCRKLSESLSNGKLEGIFIPSVEQQEDRGIIRVYKQLVRDQTRSKNRIKSWLDFQGITLPNQFSSGWSNNFLLWLKKLPLSPSAKTSLDLLLRSYELNRSMVVETLKRMRALCQQARYLEDIRLLRTIPGIGPVTALLILLEIGDINRFKGLNQVADYIGLVPDLESSGENTHVKGLTRRGHHILREALIEASWVAARRDPALTLSYAQYCKKMKANKAIIKITRKVLNRVRFVLKNKHPYILGVTA